jgi:hypothetical protein
VARQGRARFPEARAGLGIGLRALKWQAAITVGVLIAGYAYSGGDGVAAVALLVLFETSLSFDNAIVNAQVMRRMSAFWKRMFLVVGVPIAAIGMRFAFPIIIVAVAGGVSVTDLLQMALHHPVQYERHLHDAAISINTLGGAFLLIVFLEFFFKPEPGTQPWLGPVERTMAKFGRMEAAAVGLVLLVVILDSRLVSPDKREVMLLSGLAAVILHIVASGTATALNSLGRSLKHAGLATFVYLEILDASFSFDGVVGAFAISDQVVIICLGLGVGAMFVRTLTSHFDRTGTLVRYVYLGNGAHWAVGTLALILFVKNSVAVPEPFTALIGIVIIGAALYSSMRVNRTAGRALDSRELPAAVVVEQRP